MVNLLLLTRAYIIIVVIIIIIIIQNINIITIIYKTIIHIFIYVKSNLFV